MKKVKQTGEKNFFKKTFIKLCRIIGYEIIDQNNFESPTLDKKLTDNLSILGNKSISIPLGEVKITRRVKSLTIYMRTCAKVYLWKQNKERIFGKEKSEYSLRSLKSILESINYAKDRLQDVNFNIFIIDDNSGNSFLSDVKKLLAKYKITNNIIILNSDEYKDKTQDTNFASIYKSYVHAKEEADDLIYFVVSI